MAVVKHSSIVILILLTLVVADHSTGAGNSASLEGRWRVKAVISGVEENLIFVAQKAGSGTFQSATAGDKRAPGSQPASWSQLADERVSVSGETEMPLGTCCREMGTLILKGKFGSSRIISGKLVFVTNIDEEESPYKFRSVVGTFTAERISD